MTICVFDLETTGLSPETDSIVEIAVVVMSDEGKIQKTFSSLVNPGRQIPPIASGIHHIVDAMVEGAPSLTEALLQASVAIGLEKVVCNVAHFAQFDSGFLPAFSPWICTWRLAQHLWAEAPSHSNMTLRYWIPGLNDELKSNTAGINPWPMQLPAHRAMADAWVTSHILRRMLATHTLKELMALSPRPLLLRTVRFGKHRGELWSRVPTDYLGWVLKQNFESDVLHTVRHYLNSRA